MLGSGNERRLPNWIESFIQYSSSIQSPVIFRKWAAIGIVAAVMERKVWARTKGSDLFPNLYAILVGPPGVGKSEVLSITEALFRKVTNIFVAPSSLTTASLIDTIALSKRQMVTPGLSFQTMAEFHSLQVVASELGVFLPAYDPAFMNTLTKLYDGEHYEERRRTGKVNHLIIERPLLSIIAGSTPSYLNQFLPEGAWDQGFTSRTMFIYSNQIIKKPIWDEDDKLAELEADLVTDLRLMSSTYGRVEWSGDCKAAISAWDADDLEPIPKHNKLTHYNTRRLAHLIKLCIISSMARSCDRFITLEDYQTARDWLLEAEREMPDIFDASGTSIDSRAIDDVLYYIKKLYYRDGKKPVGDHMLVTYLRSRVQPNNVRKMIEIMIQSQDIKPVNVQGVVCYIPLEKTIQ
jgi:hypothetical protein